MINSTTDNFYNILIVEDNLILIDAIEMMIKLLPQNESLKNFNVHQALDYESAVVKIGEARDNNFFDVIILDINLGKSKDGERRSGKELGVLIRKHSPNAKIIVFTSNSDSLRINSILKSVNPEGFLIKDGTTNHNMFQEVLLRIIKGETYYCNAVLDIQRRGNK